MVYANLFAATIRPGYEKAHHATSHEEPFDENLG